MAELNPYVTCVTASDALELILTAGVYHPPPSGALKVLPTLAVWWDGSRCFPAPIPA